MSRPGHSDALPSGLAPEPVHFTSVFGCPRLPPVGQCAPFMDTPTSTPTRRALANAIRALSMDAVQAANSGHPGAPMGMADIAEVLWRDVLGTTRAIRRWWNRDRFVLSNGHGSMLLYSLLHLTGYPVTIDELKNFRQLGSRTAGHPERDLGHGHRDHHRPAGPGPRECGGHGARGEVVSHAVQPRWPRTSSITTPTASSATAASWKASRTKPPRSPGTSSSASSSCSTTTTASRSTARSPAGSATTRRKRFEAYGWHVVKNVDGHDAEAVAAAIKKARGAQGSAVHHLLQDHHRLGRAQQAGHQVRARRGAGSG